MNYVIENKDQITEFVTKLVELWGVMQLIGFVLSIVLPPLIALGTTILSIIGVVISVIGIFQALGAILALINLPVLLLVVAIGLLVWMFVEAFTFGQMLGQGLYDVFNGIILPAAQEMVTGVLGWLATLRDDAIIYFEEMRSSIYEKAVEIYNTVVDEFKRLKGRLLGFGWKTLGGDMMRGMADGIENAAKDVIAAIVKAVEDAIAAAKALLASFSPSRVFMELGRNTMEGMAIGITKSMGMATGAMEKAVMGVVAPAIAAPNIAAAGSVSSVHNYTNNYNLSISSSASTEPIVQDFNMLKSMSGA